VHVCLCVSLCVYDMRLVKTFILTGGRE